MSELRAVTDGGRVRLRFAYEVDGEWVDDVIALKGIRPPNRWELYVDLQADVTDPAVRRRLLDAHAELSNGAVLPTLPRPIEDPIALLEGLEAWLEEMDDSDPFEASMFEWIAEHGSRRLALAAPRGYKVTRLYAQERAAREFPGFWVDTSGKAVMRDRTDPTERALDLETTIDALVEAHEYDCLVEVVWLVEPPPDLEAALDEIGEIFEPQEAVVVWCYLGRYELILPVDDRLRRSTRPPDGD